MDWREMRTGTGFPTTVYIPPAASCRHADLSSRFGVLNTLYYTTAEGEGLAAEVLALCVNLRTTEVILLEIARVK